MKLMKLDIQLFAETLLKTWGTYYTYSGTSTPKTYGDGAFDQKGEIKVYLTGQDSGGNYSSIRIDHYSQAYNSSSSNIGPAFAGTSSYRANNGSYGGTYQSATLSQTYTSYANSGLVSKFMGSTYHTVYHNSDGTAQLYVNGSITIKYEVSRSSSFNIPLPTIPRYANITGFSYDSVTMTSFHFSVSADSSIDYVQYSLNGGGWTDAGNQTISGLSTGTQYNLKCRVRRTDSGLWTESGYIYITTTSQAYITNENVNFDVDTGITITFANPSGKQVDLRLETLNPTTSRLTRTNITSPYVLSLTTAEKNILFGYSTTSNTFTSRLVLKTDSNESYLNWKDGTTTISSANPIFTDFDYEDIGGDTTTTGVTTKDLTGLNTKIILGYSKLRVTIPTTKKATAQKSATMVNYAIASNVVAYSATASVVKDILNYNNNVILTSATDSRGNSTQVSKNLTTLTYSEITNDTKDVHRVTSVGKETSLSYTGTWFNSTFGAVANTLIATYRYKIAGTSTWSNGTTNITPTSTGNNFTFTGNILGDETTGFNIEQSYDIEVTLKDKLMIKTIPFTLIAGTPAYAIFGNKIALGGAYDETDTEHNVQLKGSVSLNGEDLADAIPVGSGIVWHSLVLPNGWLEKNGQAVSRVAYSELFAVIGTTYGAGDGSTTFNLPNEKGRVSVGIDTTQTEFNALGKTGGEKTHILTIPEMPVHSHDMNDSAYGGYLNRLGIRGDGGGGSGLVPSFALTNSYSVYKPQNTGGNTAHNNLQPYIVENFIIKAKSTFGVFKTTSATVIDNTTGNSTTDAPSVNAVNMQHKNESLISATLINNWVVYDTSYFHTASYYKHDGIVHLSGLIKSGTLNYPAFVLPLGYRPTKAEIFPIVATDVFGHCYVRPDGAVEPHTTSNTWVSLSGISFRVD